MYAAPKAHWLEYNDLWNFTTLLIRTLANNAVLRQMVRRLDLYLPRAACRPHNCYEIREELDRVQQNDFLYGLVKTGLGGAAGVLLLLTPKLEQLEISSDASPGSINDDPGREVLDVLVHEKATNYHPTGVLPSLHTLKLCNTLPVPLWIAFRNLRTLEIGAQYFIPDFSDWPDLDITRLTIFHHIEMLLKDPDPALKDICDRTGDMISKCPKLKDLRLYLVENDSSMWRLRSPTDKGSFNQLCRKIASVAPTLEHLDLTESAHATPLRYGYLRELGPIDTLAHFTKLKTLRVFGQALYKPATNMGDASITPLPPNFQAIEVRRPDMDFFETICDTFNTLIPRSRWPMQFRVDGERGRHRFYIYDNEMDIPN